jgi:hypothetical protein
MNSDEAHQQELEHQEYEAMNNQTPKLNAAFAKARAEIHNPKFDSENPHFRNKFASLRSVVDATVPVLAQHGIGVIQDLKTVEGGIACYTHFCHESGEEKCLGPLVMNATKNDPQGYASASTYARRYHLMAVTGVVGDPDDDGNAASESAFTSKQAKTKTRNAMLKAADAGDNDALERATKDLTNDHKAELWETFNHDQRRLITECRKANGQEEAA